MTWSRQFMAVPTSALRVDSDVSSSSPKGYTKEQLQEIAATVPAIYDRLNQGWTGSDFQAAAQSSDPRSQQLGKTFWCALGLVESDCLDS